MKPEDQLSCKRSPDIWSGISTMSNSDQILYCCKKGQGHTRVIIYITFVVLEYIMLHAKFQDHRTISSVGEDF